MDPYEYLREIMQTLDDLIEVAAEDDSVSKEYIIDSLNLIVTNFNKRLAEEEDRVE